MAGPPSHTGVISEPPLRMESTVAHFANITTLCDGRVTHMRVFQSKDEALEAAGLSE